MLMIQRVLLLNIGLFTVNRAVCTDNSHRYIITELLCGKYAMTVISLRNEGILILYNLRNIVRIKVIASACTNVRIVIEILEIFTCLKALLYLGNMRSKLHIVFFCISVVIPEPIAVGAEQIHLMDIC